MMDEASLQWTGTIGGCWGTGGRKEASCAEGKDDGGTWYVVRGTWIGRDQPSEGGLTGKTR